MSDQFTYRYALLKDKTKVPDDAIKFCCYDQNFTKATDIPSLPQNLEIFSCHINKLTNLPDLPNKLVKLICFGNILIKLPELPETLKALNAYRNCLTELPELPENIDCVWCAYNNIKYLTPRNCHIIKYVRILYIHHNPVYDGYDEKYVEGFKESL